MKKSILWGSMLLAFASSAAFAAPNVINTSQKGSLLIFPDINTTGGKNTVVRITNDNTAAITVKCYYGQYTGNPYIKPTVDFDFVLTKNQPAYWSVKTGEGTIFAPDWDNKVGELKCWAVSSGGGTQVKWNHLYGNAVVLDPVDSTSHEYTAFASFCRSAGANGTACGTTPGTLELNGTVYDNCAQYIMGNFTPRGGYVDGVSVPANNNYLNVASCTQDLSPVGYANPIVHSIVFDVWNELEQKRTGAQELADSWWRMDLGGYGSPTASPIDVNNGNFTKTNLKTDSAYFRAQSAGGYGLVGEMVRDQGELDQSAVETSNAGTRSGTIKFAVGIDHPPEKK